MILRNFNEISQIKAPLSQPPQINKTKPKIHRHFGSQFRSRFDIGFCILHNRDGPKFALKWLLNLSISLDSIWFSQNIKEPILSNFHHWIFFYWMQIFNSNMNRQKRFKGTRANRMLFNKWRWCSRSATKYWNWYPDFVKSSFTSDPRTKWFGVFRTHPAIVCWHCFEGIMLIFLDAIWVFFKNQFQ